MIIFGFGLSHKTAPLPMLERISFTPDAINDFLASLCASDQIQEAFGLSTCNRTEFLIATTCAPDALVLLLNRIHDRKGLDLRADPARTFFFTEENAIRHLFQVACGIDSLIVGENEILGQLRRAREAASDAGHIGELLDPLLLRAIDMGRRARQATSISRGNVSVASVAATQAIRALGDLSQKSGVVLGAGKTAEAAAVQLAERGLKDLTIINRTYERAHQLASSLGARETDLGQIGPILTQTDVVICATGAPHYIITLPMVESALSTRQGRPLMLLDVSVPRNIDPAVGALEGVHLCSQEDLVQLAEENRAQREAQVLEVNVLIDEEIAASQQRAAGDPSRLVAALHRQVEQVRREYLKRHGHHFHPHEQHQLEMFSSGLTRAILHDIVENLRELNLDTAEGQRRYELARELLSVPPEKNN